jgi:hypothetical protein
MTHRISKWVSHRARENWRDKWVDRLFGQILPALPAHPGVVTTMLAKAPLPELTAQLQAGQSAPAPVVDLRRVRSMSEAGAPATGQGGGADLRGSSVGSIAAGIGLLCLLGFE